ncbi:hypothetical protein, partial [Streptomyces tailanensis]|uniref:hypothetical protein n=1 Tax=Streptomyces tailanensis TaxID=2569858 RepID=UPI001C0F0C2D
MSAAAAMMEAIRAGWVMVVPLADSPHLRLAHTSQAGHFGGTELPIAERQMPGRRPAGAPGRRPG